MLIALVRAVCNCAVLLVLSLKWSGVLFTRRMAVGMVIETSQHFFAGMTNYHITTGVSKVETSATIQEPLVWSENTAEVYDQESRYIEVRNIAHFTDCTVS
jgi:hypothetical protein